MNLKAQITIFAILAILIIAVIALLFTLYQDPLRRIISGQQQDTTSILEQCVNEHVEIAVNKLLEHGGFLEEPLLFKEFEHINISYLCYTGLYYSRCTPQIPNLIDHLENEISISIGPKIDSCFQDLKNNLESDSYIVNLGTDQDFTIELLSGKARVNIARELTQEKADDSRTFNSFQTNYKTPLYDIGIITTEIIFQEAILCNSDYLQIMRANTDFNIKKIQTGDDNKIYTITYLPSKEFWKFAIRGCVLATPG